MAEKVKENGPELIKKETVNIDGLILFVKNFPSEHPELAEEFERRSSFWGEEALVSIEQRVAKREMSVEKARLLTAGLIAGNEVQGTHDSLTGLLNLRGWNERVEEAEAESIRHGSALSALALDLNELKKINDRDGHAAGDEALKIVGGVISGAIREEDFAARVGGDEFMAACPKCYFDGVIAVAERIKKELSGNVTVSISVGELNISDRESTQDFFKRLDEALYQAKAKAKEQPGTSQLVISSAER